MLASPYVSALPSVQELRAFLESRAGAATGLTDILRTFQLPVRQKASIRALLHDMAVAGDLLDLAAGTLKASIGLPDVARMRVSYIRDDGNAAGFLADDVLSRPVVLLIKPPDTPYFFPGDIVLVRLRPATGTQKREARGLRLLTRLDNNLPVTPANTPEPLLLPCDARLNLPLTPEESTNSLPLAPQQIGLATPHALPHGAYAGRVHSVLGKADDAGMPSRLSLLIHHPPTTFSEQAEAEARQIAHQNTALQSAPAPSGRTDLRHLPLITIDEASAHDFDDALWAEQTAEGFHLIVAIADVAHWVKPGSALDMEAQERGNSIYLPDRVVPMLPLALSAQACSLLPGQDRLCLFADIYITSDGHVVSAHIGRGIMQSAARLTYETVQQVFETQAHQPTLPPEHPAALLAPALLPALRNAGAAIRRAALQRGVMEREETGWNVQFDSSGQPCAFVPRNTQEAHYMVAACMILANQIAAEKLHAQALPALFRTHAQPSPDSPRPMARYSTCAASHYGLRLKHYTHFTSPIRRYADLLAHRALTHINDSSALPHVPLPAPDVALVSQLNFTERRAATIMQDSLNRLAALFLAPLIGQRMSAHVMTATRHGLRVRLTKTGTPSFLAWSAFPDRTGMNDDSQHTHALAHHPHVQSGAVLSVTLAGTCPARGTLMLTDAVYEH
ncbi:MULTISPECIES: ribonuclease R family protein [Acetobacter]|uniref:RNB domain-containing ribonuclease n=3 Tax=Acetobacter TaxID=434 RepID=A0AAN1PIE0_9PROT|nr:MULTISPECIES: ribonuclease R family protein [Acetobacter]ASL39715.1 ribonuclease R [Acetobacter oryzifermentans]AXN00858.1 RNB domain-containing ribonuclease [Acetobacter pomorum]KAA8395770.1 VacB/RNase II family 3'-5' exoribonuclease [Acetobacter sp. DmW_125124]KAA8396602.1 VacB/RNase II family 3'-5' exoribonuclease [Acetobacter sp. DmW_125128]KAA8398240.1 VacB/RNase II family 3'-5' exoribonuclease [Acetobacter sp. DmW_125127]